MALSRRSMILSGVAVTGGLAVAYGLQSLKDGDAREKFAATAAGRELLLEGRRRRVSALEERIARLEPSERAAIAAAIAALERVSRAS